MKNVWSKLFKPKSSTSGNAGAKTQSNSKYSPNYVPKNKENENTSRDKFQSKFRKGFTGK